jgi:hypothetical protein
MFGKSTRKPSLEEALPGRDELMPLNSTWHFLNQHKIVPSWPDTYEHALFGMGCLGCGTIVLAN